MENKKIPSNKKLISIQEERLVRQVDYDSIPESSSRSPKKLILEITKKASKDSKHPSQKVLVSIKPKSPAIKTLFLAEKNRFQSIKSSDKAGSRLALGDHSSFTTHVSNNDSCTLDSESVNCLYKNCAKSEIVTSKNSKCTTREEASTDTLQCTDTDSLTVNSTINKANIKERLAEKCFMYTQPQFTMTIPNNTKIIKYKNNNKPKKVDIGTFIVTKSSTEDTVDSSDTIKNINKRIAHLERKILRQEMVFQSMSPKINISSSNEDSKDHIMTRSHNDRPGCSYVEYSHIPETSAFQKYSQQPAPLTASKATTIQKEHNSEQYGRDFTLYDNITSRGRRQCASVPCKRDDGQKLAADRVHKIRHKLNPIRDYRLMDTVHYLAQGEFAPRDDGIKLTPSREAVLSDIIWEDVCRTHWPNTRLARRVHPERCGPRSELQRLIDNLLRERVAHIERRRRRHYRVVKLNHRHDNCRPLGKTGDIIVASHKNRPVNDDRDVVDDHTLNNISIQGGRHSHKQHKSYDFIKETKQISRQFRDDDSAPGPSNAARHSSANRETTCCYHSFSQAKQTKASELVLIAQKRNIIQNLTSDSSNTTSKERHKNPRLVVKKNSSRRKNKTEEPNLEHFILLPTLVIKTPSNMKRQKKFNELYHRILNVQLNKAKANNNENLTANYKTNKREVGLNIDFTVSNSEESTDNEE